MIADQDLAKFLATYPALSRAEVSTVAELLLRPAAQLGFGLPAPKVWRLLHLAAADSQTSGYGFCDIVLAHVESQPTTSPESSTPSTSQPLLTFPPQLTLLVVGNDPQAMMGLMRGILAQNGPKPQVHAVPVSCLSKFENAQQVSLVMWAAPAQREPALQELKQIRRLISAPVLAVGTGDLGLALRLVMAGAAQFLPLSKMDKCLLHFVHRCFTADPPSPSLAEPTLVNSTPETSQAKPSHVHITAAFRQVLIGAVSTLQVIGLLFCALFSLALRPACLIACGILLSAGLCFLGWHLGHTMFGETLASLQTAFRSLGQFEPLSPAHSLTQSLQATLGGGGLAGFLYYLASRVMLPAVR